MTRHNMAGFIDFVWSNIIITCLLCCCCIKQTTTLQEVSRCCNTTGSYSMILYTHNNTNWQGASGDCQNLGMELVSVWDQEVQRDITQWLNSLGDHKPERVWTSGRQSGDGVFRYNDGTQFDKVAGTEAGNCLFGTGTDKYYTIENCDETNAKHRFVCEYSDNTQCSHGTIANQTCYINHGYPGGYGRTRFSVHEFCLSNGGIVAQTGLRNKTLLEQLGLAADRKLFWTGVTRHNWQWRNDKQMEYYNWKDGAGDTNGLSYCMMLNGQHDYQWEDVDCETQLSHFVCTNNSEIYSQDQNGENTTPVPNTEPINQEIPIIAYIIPIVVVILMTPIGVVVYVILRKRKSMQSNKQQLDDVIPDEYLSTHDKPVINKNLTSFQPENPYASVDMDQDETLQENIISPYGEYQDPTHATQNNNGSSQQADSPTQNSPTHDDDDDIAAMYAQPIKKKKKETGNSKKKQKPTIKTPKPTKLNAKGKAVISRDQSHSPGGNSEPMDIDHVAAPQGDLYAMPMKSKKP